VVRPTLLLAGFAAIAFGALAGCSDTWVAAVGDGIATAQSEDHKEDQPAPAAIGIGKAFAKVALDDQELGGIRGGLSIGSGVVLNFAFQEATFVNHNLTQNVVIPTITVSPGSTTASVAGVTVPGGGVSNFSPNSVAGVGALGTPVSSPALAVQSILNSGMTQVVSSIGGGGVTNLISNTANNQLIQQVITANINISGLSQTVQQSVASTVLSRVQAATSQFR
jgi:hypothetical protein